MKRFGDDLAIWMDDGLVEINKTFEIDVKKEGIGMDLEDKLFNVDVQSIVKGLKVNVNIKEFHESDGWIDRSR